MLSQAVPRVVRADARQITVAFCSLSTFLLNAALFVLVGLELQSAVRGLSSVALARGVVAVAAVTVVIIGVRFAWIFQHDIPDPPGGSATPTATTPCQQPRPGGERGGRIPRRGLPRGGPRRAEDGCV